METQEELDRKETEAYAQLKKEEETENRVQHDALEPTTYDLAEAELKYEERQHKYLFDAKHEII